MKKIILFFIISFCFVFNPSLCFEDEDMSTEKLTTTQCKYNKNKEFCIDQMGEFFSEMKKEKEIQSYRLFNIWVSGEFASYRKDIFIGGNEEESEKWFYGAFVVLKSGESVFGKNFLFELILDMPTYKTQAQKLEELKKQFPCSFKCSFMEDIVEPLTKKFSKDGDKQLIKQSLLQFQKGNPAFVSDIVRILMLFSHYDINVYLDVDSLIERIKMMVVYEMKATELYNSQLTAKNNVVYSNAYTFGKTNDYLFVIKPKKSAKEKLRFLLDHLVKSIRLNFPILHHHYDRQRFLKISYATYVQAINNLANQLIENNGIFNFTHAVMDSTGPAFWKDCVYRGLSEDTVYSEQETFTYVSNASWKPENASVGNELFSYVEYISMLDKSLKSLKPTILLALFGSDLEYFLHFEKECLFLSELKRDVWNLFSEFEKVFAKPIKREQFYYSDFGVGIDFVYRNQKEIFGKSNEN